MGSPSDPNDFGVSSEDVRAQAQGPMFSYGQTGDALRAQGRNPLEAVFAAREGRAFTPPEQPKQPSPYDKAKNDAVAFYMQDANDPTMASVVAGSKGGEAFFNLYEPVKIASGTVNKQRTYKTYLIAPRGQRAIVDNRTGQQMNIPVHMIAARKGVKIVPHKGGDEGARAFRSLLTDAGTVMETLADLEGLYADNAMMFGVSPFPDDKRARSLESMLLQGVGKILNGSKSLGAGVSDRDLQIIEQMVPQRASGTVTGYDFGGSESQKLIQLRSKIEEILKRTANVNGIDLLEPKSEQQQQGGRAPSGFKPIR